MSSGSLAAMSVFELRWKPDIQRKEKGKRLVLDAIAAGALKNLFPGSNIDLCVINKDGAQYLRPFEEANKKETRTLLGTLNYDFQVGTTGVLQCKRCKIDITEECVHMLMPGGGMESMVTA